MNALDSSVRRFHQAFEIADLAEANGIDVVTDYHERLGFDGLVFWPVFGDPLDQARRFVEEVRPRLPPLFQA
ncbi:hypothetical protein [Tenggerimyces flavus]|uniref:Luciferase-like domain-containing protein n=1 Tax=Tenggerimyces flavus TaxID=1708749 RepID=A0ABV7Y4J6_9ACTN|nr:hypothetical protein [Tenggerimyces flavus]MBM7788238.1 hypothetical protein [Tenggerimyces flavus]